MGVEPFHASFDRSLLLTLGKLAFRSPTLLNRTVSSSVNSSVELQSTLQLVFFYYGRNIGR